MFAFSGNAGPPQGDVGAFIETTLFDPPPVNVPAPIAGAGVPGLILASGGREATTIGNRRMVLSVAGGNVWRLKAVD
jgi:hypothetical protein